MSQSESFAPFCADRYEAKLRRRKLGKAALLGGLIAGIAWLIIESASAITMF